MTGKTQSRIGNDTSALANHVINPRYRNMPFDSNALEDKPIGHKNPSPRNFSRMKQLHTIIILSIFQFFQWQSTIETETSKACPL